MLLIIETYIILKNTETVYLLVCKLIRNFITDSDLTSVADSDPRIRIILQDPDSR